MKAQKYIGFFLLFLAGTLCGQEDYYLDRQQKRIFTYSREEVRKVVNFNALLPIEQSCLNWLRNQQQPCGLVESYESGKVSYTYDDSLAVLAFLLYDETALAKKVLDFYKKVWEREKRTTGRFNGFADMYRVSGETGNDSRAVGPNAWLLMALNDYIIRTGDRSMLALAGDLADWMLSFQNRYNGGLWGGVNENKADFLWMSTEHNLDAYAALQVFYALTGISRYKSAALRIREWLTGEMWDQDRGRFYNGLDDPNYATDVSSWAVLSLADRRFSPALDFAIRYSGNRQFYRPNNREVSGFDFGGAYARSPYPDKDAVWFEGTGQMVLAFSLFGRKEEARYYLEELRKAVVRSERFDDSTGLPYASNAGTPPYGGWTMPDRPVCVSSTAWFLFASKEFNPFYGKHNTLEELGQVMMRDATQRSNVPPGKAVNGKEKEKPKAIEQELFGE